MHQVDKYGLSDPSLAIILSNEAITKKKKMFLQVCCRFSPVTAKTFLSPHSVWELVYVCSEVKGDTKPGKCLSVASALLYHFYSTFLD